MGRVFNPINTKWGGYLTHKQNGLERMLTPLLNSCTMHNMQALLSHCANACCACTNWPMCACICTYLEFGHIMQAASNHFCKVTDIAWQSVLYGLYNTEYEGIEQSHGWAIWYATATLHVLYIRQGWGTFTLLGSNSQCILLTHILVLQDDKLPWCIYLSPGQCHKYNTS